MKQQFYILSVFALSAFTASPAEPENAYLKAQYEQWSVLGNNTENPSPKIEKFILQIGEGKSYYYDPQTFFVDSLKNDPAGSVIYDETFGRLLHESVENKTMYLTKWKSWD